MEKCTFCVQRIRNGRVPGEAGEPEGARTARSSPPASSPAPRRSSRSATCWTRNRKVSKITRERSATLPRAGGTEHQAGGDVSVQDTAGRREVSNAPPRHRGTEKPSPPEGVKVFFSRIYNCYFSFFFTSFAYAAVVHSILIFSLCLRASVAKGFALWRHLSYNEIDDDVLRATGKPPLSLLPGPARPGSRHPDGRRPLAVPGQVRHGGGEHSPARRLGRLYREFRVLGRDRPFRHAHLGHPVPRARQLARLRVAGRRKP